MNLPYKLQFSEKDHRILVVRGNDIHEVFRRMEERMHEVYQPPRRGGHR